MLGGAGLGRDLNAGDGPLLLGEFLGADHQICEFSCDLRGNCAALLGRRGRADVGEVRSLQSVDQMGLHHDTVVGDRGGNHRVLQRRHRDVLLPHARHTDGGGIRHRPDGRLGHLKRNRRRHAVETERVGGIAYRVTTHPDTQLDERGVAGPREGLPQRCGGSVAAWCAAVVLQRRGAVGQRDLRGCGQRFAIADPGLKCGRGGDHLERGARRIALGHGAVGQRGVRVVTQLRPRLPLGLGVVGGQQIGVERRRGHHRQDLPARGLQRDHRTLARAATAFLHRVPGGLLDPRQDGGVDVPAARVAPGEEVGEALTEQPLVGSVEYRVLGSFQTCAGEAQRVEAGDRGVGERFRVHPQEAVAAVGGHRVRQQLPAGGDLAALPGVLVEQHALVARIRAQTVGPEDLGHRGIGQQQHDQSHDHQRDPAQ